MLLCLLVFSYTHFHSRLDCTAQSYSLPSLTYNGTSAGSPALTLGTHHWCNYEWSRAGTTEINIHLFDLTGKFCLFVYRVAGLNGNLIWNSKHVKKTKDKINSLQGLLFLCKQLWFQSGLGMHSWIYSHAHIWKESSFAVIADNWRLEVKRFCTSSMYLSGSCQVPTPLIWSPKIIPSLPRIYYIWWWGSLLRTS